MDNKSQSDQVALTDKNFRLLSTYFPYGARMSRTPYFSTGYVDIFAPIFGNGIYEIQDSCVSMRYYVKFEKEFEDIERSGTEMMKYAAANDMYYMYDNPLCSKRYIFQNFKTSKELSGTLMIDRVTNKAVLVDKFLNSRQDMQDDYRFEGITGYDHTHNAFMGLTFRRNVESSEWLLTFITINDEKVF